MIIRKLGLRGPSHLQNVACNGINSLNPSGFATKLAKHFSKKSRGPRMHRVLKDNTFSYKGYYKPKKSKPKQYDLEGVENAHLYYDHKVDAPKERKAYRKRLKIRRGEHEMNEENYEKIIEDLVNPNLLSRGSEKIFLRIRQLEDLHEDKAVLWKKVVQHIMNRALGGLFLQYNLRTFALILFYASKHTTIDAERFRKVSLHVLGMFKNLEYQEETISDAQKKEDRYTTIVRSLKTLYFKSNLHRQEQASATFDSIFSQIFESCVAGGQFQTFEEPRNLLQVLDAVTESRQVVRLNEELSAYLTEIVEKQAKDEQLQDLARNIDAKLKFLDEKNVKKLYMGNLGKLQKAKVKGMYQANKIVGFIRNILSYEDLITQKGVQNNLGNLINKLAPLINKLPISSIQVLSQAIFKAEVSDEVQRAISERLAEYAKNQEVEDLSFTELSDLIRMASAGNGLELGEAHYARFLTQIQSFDPSEDLDLDWSREHSIAFFANQEGDVFEDIKYELETRLKEEGDPQ